MVRYPAAIGFYPGNKIDLKRAIEESFLHEYGPKRLPPIKESKLVSKFTAGISPHAGYIFSGPIAANLYYEMSQVTVPKTVILMGPSHYFPSNIVAVTRETPWLTPLGEVNVNISIVDKLLSENDLIIDEPAAHTHEHSLEVQLPFLQYIYKDSFDIVPLVFGSLTLDEIISIGDTLYKIIATNPDSFSVIISSDFTHYGSGYGFTPAGSSVEKAIKWMYSMDKKAIDYITSLDYESFYNFVSNNNMTICGYVPITAALYMLRKLDVSRGKLLKYATSWDTAPDYRSSSHIVGYAAIFFKRMT
ncbi:MAG: AmmeMemoRadiSam system protein B [Candidatus Asgardarchaeia archaeon]